MRKLFAALVGAAAAMPLLALAATPSFPDPSDPGASVPTVTVPPAFADYHGYEDKVPGSWSGLNHAAMETSRMGGMSHGQMPPTSAPVRPGHAEHGGTSK